MVKAKLHGARHYPCFEIAWVWFVKSWHDKTEVLLIKHTRLRSGLLSSFKFIEQSHQVFIGVLFLFVVWMYSGAVMRLTKHSMNSLTTSAVRVFYAGVARCLDV